MKNAVRVGGLAMALYACASVSPDSEHASPVVTPAATSENAPVEKSQLQFYFENPYLLYVITDPKGVDPRTVRLLSGPPQSQEDTLPTLEGRLVRSFTIRLPIFSGVESFLLFYSDGNGNPKYAQWNLTVHSYSQLEANITIDFSEIKPFP